MVAGGFIGGLIAGSCQCSALAAAALILGSSFGLLALMGHGKGRAPGELTGTVLHLSTVISLPAGMIGVIIAKAWTSA
jgi:hypothetical protein